MANANNASCRRAHKATGEVIPEVYKYEDGMIEIGHLHDNKRSGRWMMFFPEGYIFDGQCDDGNMHGPGKWLWENGDISSGSYKDGKKHGVWILKLGDATCRDNYIDGHSDGTHTFTYGNGEVHEGLRDNDLNRIGWWTITKPDGTVAVGEYKDNKKHGLWAEVDSGKTHEIEYIDGERSSHYRITSKDGKIAEGEVDIRGERHGHWTLTTPEGSYYWGDYESDKKHGCWYQTFADGSYHRGYYRRGVKHGPWIYIARGADGFKYIDAGTYSYGQKMDLWKKQGWCSKASAGWCHEREYLNGMKHGLSREVLVSGRVREVRYNRGRKIGRPITTDVDGFVTSERASRYEAGPSAKLETLRTLEGQHDGPLKGTLNVVGEPGRRDTLDAFILNEISKNGLDEDF